MTMDYRSNDQRRSTMHRIWEATVTVSNWLQAMTVAGAFLLLALHAYHLPRPIEVTRQPPAEDGLRLIAIGAAIFTAMLWGLVVARLRQVRAASR